MNANRTNRRNRMRLLQFAPAFLVGAFLIVLALHAFGSPSPAAAQTDTTAPTVSSIAITSDPDDDIREDVPYVARGGTRYVRPSGIYGIGDDIEVTVTFDEDVAVIGSPKLDLKIGRRSKTADYSKVVGAAVVFSYKVAEGDSDTDGVAIDANKLKLNGGSIRDDAGNDADLTHDALAAQADHEVDGIRPRMSLEFMNVGSMHGANGFKSAGDWIWVQIKASDYDPGYPSVTGPPQLTLDFDGEEKIAEWNGGNLGEIFEYVVQEGDLDTDGVVIKANSISLNGGFIKDQAGNDAILTHSGVRSSFNVVDAVVPSVTSMAITSDPVEDDTYDVGDQIEITVTFSETVRVPEISRNTSNGILHSPKPSLELDIGGESKMADFRSYRGADLVFTYNVQAGDTDVDGISIGANKLHLDGSVIWDNADNNPISATLSFPPLDAVVSHDALADDSGHKVAGSPSSLILTGPTTPEYKENSVAQRKWVVVDDLIAGRYSVSGTDAEISWSLSGDDGSLFSLKGDNTRRVLWFNSQPNYEDPEDADADNIYRVTIEASDGTNAGSLQVAVQVTNDWLDSDEVPTIIGTALVGETLTADLSRISGPNGYPGEEAGTFYLFWHRIDGATETEIDGATDSTYTLTADDKGKRIKVVAWGDYGEYGWAGDERVRHSEPTAVVVAEVATDYPPAPTNLAVSDNGNGTLTLTWDAPDDDSVTGYQILRRRPNEGEKTLLVYVADTGSTDTTWTDEDVTVGTRHVYRVKANNAVGLSQVSSHAGATPASPPENNAATGAPTITGTARVGETLTAGTSGISDDNGLDSATFSYQWLADDAEISGATSSTYTLAAAEEGKAVKVRVSFTDDAGHDETLTSAATSAVAAPQPDLASVSVIGINTLSGIYAGRTFRLNAGVRNVGAGASASTTLRYYQSTDSTIDTADTEVGTYDVAALAAGESDNETSELTAPDTAGTYYFGACVDAVADESDTTNNCSSGYEISVLRWNSPATGAATIKGKAQVGKTLTASTSGISDDDGLDNAVFSYRWLADDADLSGATGSTYTLVDSDKGKAVKVKVSFTDDAGNDETLTSAATSAVALPPPQNSPAAGAPMIRGTARVGETLTARTTRITDGDGLTDATFSYQWLADDADISGATGSTYTLVEADKGKAIKVKVSFTDDSGNDESLSSAATSAVVAALPPPAPTNLVVSDNGNGTLTLTWDAPDDDSVTGYQILRRRPTEGENTLLVYVADTGSTDTNWTDEDVTIGTQHVYRVKAINAAGLSGASNFDRATPTSPPENNAATGAPTISGTAQVGETLTADTSGMSDADGLDNAVFSYQWLADDTNISGATGSTYTPVDSDEGKAVKVRVSFTDDAGHAETLTSTATAAVAPKPNSPASGQPTISGTAQVGETLTAGTSGISDADGLTNATFSYQWLADDTSISGATGSTYTLVDSDEGKAVKVRVSFTDDAGHAESLTSAATSSVEAAPNLFTASTHQVPESHDGQNAFTFELRFSEEFSISYKTLRDHAFTVTGGTVTKARRLEKPSNARWEITVVPSSNSAVTIELPATTDCEEQGGICTSDGRKLSNSLNFTVSGPG